ncbi:alpha/beta-hydrolase [Pholiota conissans]|uniref:GPI inositol-deacylase n=1 Tax=Pholiota conissans TaxID=109636 RepID=A0A9P5Z218_9AGAR|nr:alpha/beta-hydrolase [Pholiota conissans]
MSNSSLSSLSIQDTQAPSTISASFSRWWFQPDTLLSQEDRSESPTEIKKKYLSPKNPVVFCHGLLGFDSVTIGPSIAPFEVTHWRGIKEVLEENGTEVLITRVPATSSPVERAKVLEAKISAVYPGRSVHLIGHSMGGLDCRYMTTHLTHRLFKVLSITTIATPHRGSSFADHFLSTVGRARMPSVMSLLDLLPNGGGDGAAFECLTIDSMRKFNEDCPDVPGVRYFSWGAVYEPGLIDTWKWPHSVILEKEGPNDGLVSVESSKWGTYLGTLSQVNHLDLVGWINTARYKWAEMMGKEIKFRPATFYLGIADMLAREVEGQGKEGESEEDTRVGAVEASNAGAGVQVEEGSGAAVPSARTSKSADTLDLEAQQVQKRQSVERAQMTDSLAIAGAEVYEGQDKAEPMVIFDADADADASTEGKDGKDKPLPSGSAELSANSKEPAVPPLVLRQKY